VRRCRVSFALPTSASQASVKTTSLPLDHKSVNVDVVHVATCGARSLARLGSPTHRHQLADPRRRRGKSSVRSIKHFTDNFPNFRPALQTNERPAQFPERAPSVSLSVQLRGFIWPPRLRARSSRLVRRPSWLHSRSLGRVQHRLRCWLLYARWQARIIRLGDVDHGGRFTGIGFPSVVIMRSCWGPAASTSPDRHWYRPPTSHPC
jgi:hypothetical protein